MLKTSTLEGNMGIKLIKVFELKSMELSYQNEEQQKSMYTSTFFHGCINHKLRI